MSDDEEVYVKKQKIVHYGSLEESERARIAAAVEDGSDDDKDDSTPNKNSNSAMSAGNVHISTEYMDLEDEMSKDRSLCTYLREYHQRGCLLMSLLSFSLTHSFHSHLLQIKMTTFTSLKDKIAPDLINY